MLHLTTLSLRLEYTCPLLSERIVRSDSSALTACKHASKIFRASSANIAVTSSLGVPGRMRNHAPALDEQLLYLDRSFV
jgi:hypothetical protein